MSALGSGGPGPGFWDERYAAEGFAYGTAPNRWLESQAGLVAPRGRVLSLGEGEGRNAVWLAERGFAVDAVDSSAVGLAKAERLARDRGVAIRTVVADLARFRPEPGSYDALVLVFVHLPPSVREAVHAAAAAGLRPGAAVILEAFTPRQLGRASGGPPRGELLYEPEEVRSDFPGVAWLTLAEAEVDLDEGPFHRGRAAVVRGAGRIAAPAVSP